MRQQLEYFVCFSTTVLKKDVLILEYSRYIIDVLILEGRRKKKGCRSEQVIVLSLWSKSRLGLVNAGRAHTCCKYIRVMDRLRMAETNAQTQKE